MMNRMLMQTSLRRRRDMCAITALSRVVIGLTVTGLTSEPVLPSQTTKIEMLEWMADPWEQEVPSWVVAALQSPDAQVRLRALEAWAQQKPSKWGDILLRACTDPNERVRKRALQILEDESLREQEELTRRR